MIIECQKRDSLGQILSHLKKQEIGTINPKIVRHIDVEDNDSRIGRIVYYFSYLFQQNTIQFPEFEVTEKSYCLRF